MVILRRGESMGGAGVEPPHLDRHLFSPVPSRPASPGILLTCESRRLPLGPQPPNTRNHQSYKTVRPAAFLSVAYMHFVLQALQPDQRFSLRRFIVLTVTTAVGILTHFHFLLLIGSCTLVILFRAVVRKEARPALQFLGATGTGLILFVLFHPQFLNSILGERNSSLRMNTEEIYFRAVDFALNHGAFFIPIHFAKYALMILALLLGGTGIVWLLKKRKSAVLELRKTDRPEIHLFLVYLILLAMTSTLYILGFSPRHAVSARYHAMLYPMLACLPVFILRWLPARMRTALLIVLCCWQTTYGVIKTIAYERKQADIDTQETLPTNPGTYLLDSVARGELPRILFTAPDKARVFAAWQDTLLTYPERYIDGIRDSTLYVSSLRYFNTTEKSHRIIELLQDHGFKSLPVSDNFLGIGEAFLITRATNGRNVHHP